MTYLPRARRLASDDTAEQPTQEHRFKKAPGQPDNEGGAGWFAAIYVVGLGLVVGAVLWFLLL